METPERSRRSSSLDLGVLGLIVVAGAVLSSLFIGEKSLWIDEAATHWITSLETDRFVSALWNAEANGTLYYLLLRAWRVLGDSETVLRSLSALFAVATVVPLYALVRRVGEAWIALAACALLVANSFWLHYAQEARSYSLAMFLCTLGTLLLVRAWEVQSTRRWIAYGLIMGAAFYAHFYAGFVLIGHLVATGGRRDVETFARRSMVGWALPILLAVPLFAFMLFNDNGQIDWLERPGTDLFLSSITEMAAGGVVAIAYGLCLVSAAVASFGTRDDSDGVTLFWLWLLIPVLLGFLVSQVKPVFYPRFLIVSLPALCALAAIGVGALRPRAVAIAGYAALLVLSALSLPDWYDHNKQPWRDITETIAERSREGDVIVMAPYARRPIEYYVERTGVAESFPEPVWPQGDWGTYPTVIPPFPTGYEETEVGVAGAERVWFAFVIPTHPLNQARMDLLEPDCRPAFKDAAGKLRMYRCPAQTSR